jgi:hypothetical protein
MDPTPERYWRGLILFGINESSYKMGLGHLLLNYSLNGQDTVSLDDLSVDFLNLFLERCKNNKPQMGQIGKKTYIEHEIDAIRYRKKDISEAAAVVKTKALSDMVLLRFNNLFGKPIPEPFYQFNKGDRSIILNPILLEICQERESKEILEKELFSRWDLLEHSFERKHPVPLVPDERLEYLQNWEERKNLTPLSHLLWGYQQGRCFYCGEELFETHIDHVIPHSAIGSNDVWNLVLADDICNEQKLDTLPSWEFLEKLIRRNEYYIASSHPMKEEIIRKLGKTPKERRATVRKHYDQALKYKQRYWQGDPHYDPSKDEDFLFLIRWFKKR